MELRPGRLRSRLKRELGDAWKPLAVVVEAATRRDVPVFLVGGPVRDLLLERPVLDVDLLLADRLADVARDAAARLGVKPRIHARFLTATLEGSEFRVDLSRARTESYAHPGALPEVLPAASIELDLPRRDFAAHALALPLNTASGRRIVDPLGGIEDLRAKRLRVLHENSFRDDPTRLLRAARYAARLGFRLERGTARLLREALAARFLDRVSGDRVLHEIERLTDEFATARVASTTARLGLFGAIAKGWKLTPDARRALARLDRFRAAPAWPEAPPELLREVGLRLLWLGLPARVRSRGLARLGLSGRPAAAIDADLRRLAPLGRALRADPKPGRLDALLGGLPDTALITAFCALPGASPRRISHFIRELRHLPSPLDGHAAQALGASGPEVGDLIRAARLRALDGKPVSADWAQVWLARRNRMG